jgi:3-hydroxyisobutyrate dehydrogenase-like beta-hydroxyacid dehydrogenase
LNRNPEGTLVVKTVAFIGLGSTGAPMARDLLAAGYDLIGYLA